MPTKAKTRRKATAKAKRTRRKPFDMDGFIDRAPNNPDPRCRAWATVLWLARTQGTTTVVWNDEVAAVYFDLYFPGEPWQALRALEESGLCSIEWGEDGDADTGRMPDVPIITILTRKPRKEPKR